MDEVVLRPMLETDAVAVAELAGELGYPSTASEIVARIRLLSSKDLAVVATTPGGEVAGFIQANRSGVIEAGYSVEIVGLVVSSKIRRSGAGRRLIKVVEDWAKDIGVERIVVRSNTKRTESHQFYPALGFQRIKTQAVYEKRLVP